MDKYMSLLCSLCKESLEKAYEFKKQCKNAFTIRRAYFFPDDTIKDSEQSSSEDKTNFQSSFKDEDDSDFEEHLFNDQDEECDDGTTIEMVKVKDQPEEVSPIVENQEEEQEEPSKTYRTRTVVTRSKKNDPKKNIVETLTYLADHNEKFFLCKRCNKQFANPRTLQAHMLRHTGLKKYVCNFCGKQNFTLSEHQSHMVLHKPDQPFTCNVCTKSFKEKARLATHMKSHTKERKYMCDLCGKKFIYLSNLNCHKLMHSDARTYECKICKKAFKMHSTLKVHMDMHKNRTFQCEICKKMFQTYAGMYFFVGSIVVHFPAYRVTCA